MISVNDFKTGIVIKYKGQLYSVVEFLHVKPGKGSAFVRSKLKNLKTGLILEKTFNAGEKVEDVFIENRQMQFLYNTGNSYVFMDNTSYEQVELDKEFLGDAIYFIKDGSVVDVSFYENQAIGVNLPKNMVLKVEKTEPGIKGDRVSGATKPAILETGLKVMVPLFVQEGDNIMVDTRTKQYLKRA